MDRRENELELCTEVYRLPSAHLSNLDKTMAVGYGLFYNSFSHVTNMQEMFHFLNDKLTMYVWAT